MGLKLCLLILVEPEVDYAKITDAMTEKTKVVIHVDIGSVMVVYDKVRAAVKSKKHLYHPNNDIQALFDRPIIIADAAHSFRATYQGSGCGLYKL